MTERHNSGITHKLYIGCFAAIVLLAVILRIYKAYYTGVIYDEALTYFRFSRDFNSAISNYSSTNNHLLNSVLIYLSVKVFGQSFIGVPAIRLPAVFFGIVYVVSIALVIEAALRGRVLKILVLGACLFNYLIFDLTILARGYAIALGAVYLELLVIVLYPKLLKDKADSMVILFSALNFIALGAMLTSLYTVVPLNLAFLAVMFHRLKAGQLTASDRLYDALKKTVQAGVVILCLSSLALALLYNRVFTKIISASGKHSEVNDALITILKSLITEGLFTNWEFPLSTILNILQTIILPLMVALTVLFLLNVIVSKKTLPTAALIVLSVLAASFLFAYAARTAAGVSLGFTRNHVFWLPLIFISAGIVMDGARISPLVPLKTSIYVVTCLMSVVLIAGPLMALHVVTTHDWKPQSVVGPLLRQLNKTDPLRRWRVGFSDKLEYNLYPYLFYNNEAYRIIDSNAAVYHISEKDLHTGNLYQYDLFKKFDCVVVLDSSMRQP
ncbi:MAG: hypothetical protein H7843_02450 [Nitrospirota bacterium]